MIPITNNPLGSSDDSFVFEVSIPTSSTQFILPLISRSEYNYSFTVSWGDGTSNKVLSAIDPNARHIYAIAGKYRIRIRGKCEGFSFSTNRDSALYLSKIVDFGFISVKKIDFAGCTNITDDIPSPRPNSFANVSSMDNFLSGLGRMMQYSSLPVEIFESAINCNSFENALACCPLTTIPCIFRKNIFASSFKGCFLNSKLVSVSPDLFRYNTKVTNFAQVFNECVDLLSVPENIFYYNIDVIDFSSSFCNCKSITNIGQIFRNNSKVIKITSCFNGCVKLTTIHSDLFSSCTEIESFAGIFYNCNSLSNIPIGLFSKNTKVTSFEGTFYGCAVTTVDVDMFRYNTQTNSFKYTFSRSSIQSIPNDLFRYNILVTNFSGVFSSTIIEAVPEDLFKYNTMVLDFSQVFSSCTGLRYLGSVFKYNLNVKTFNQALAGSSCTIPDDLFQNNTEVEDFSYLFYNADRRVAIPKSLFDNCLKVKFFDFLYYGNWALPGEAPELWNRIPLPSGNKAFYSCSKLINFASIPTTWK